MATPQEKLADSLKALHELQNRGVVAIRRNFSVASWEQGCEAPRRPPYRNVAASLECK